MADEFLSRWSRRKAIARRGEKLPEEPPPASAPAAASASPATLPEGAAPPPEPPLPPVEELTPESDFTPFMRQDVDPGVRGQALKTLFQDPRFNVMDGLDVYIDDYSKPDPLPADWLGKLNQLAGLHHCVEPEKDKQAEAPAKQAMEGEQPPEIEAAIHPKLDVDQPDPGSEKPFESKGNFPSASDTSV